MAKALEYFRVKLDSTKEAFKGTIYFIRMIKSKIFNTYFFTDSKPLEEMILLINDSFDVMNGRYFSNAIHPGTWKKQRNVIFIYFTVFHLIYFTVTQINFLK